MKQKQSKIYRVIDANLNRSKEGLRVCEDTARFILRNERLTRKIKKIRHAVTEAIKSQNLSLKKVLKFRDSDNDLGAKPDYLEKNRKTISDVFLANFQRAKEGVRVLEEFTKLVDVEISDRFKKIRFKLYSLEKEIIGSF